MFKEFSSYPKSLTAIRAREGPRCAGDEMHAKKVALHYEPTSAALDGRRRAHLAVSVK